MDKQRLVLEEFLTKKLKYSTGWHPTVLKYIALEKTPVLFKKDELYLDNIGDMLLNDIPVYNIRETPPYTVTIEKLRWTLGKEFNYWAEKNIPLIVINTKGLVVTECMPNLAIGPFLTRRKHAEWWVQYLLDGNNFLTK